MIAEQLPLELRRPDDWSRAAFLVGPSNEAALKWVERWPHWPQSTLALYGPPGCGKSHLSHIAAAASGAVIRQMADLKDHSWREHPHVILEDGPGPHLSDVALFHLINGVREEGGSLLLTGERPPSMWDIALNDARSRLNAIVAIAIEEPDDVLLSQLVVKHFVDLGTLPAPEVIQFVETRVGRSFRAVGDAVYTLNQAALAQKAKITVPFVKRVMDW